MPLYTLGRDDIELLAEASEALGPEVTPHTTTLGRNVLLLSGTIPLIIGEEIGLSNPVCTVKTNPRSHLSSITLKSTNSDCTFLPENAIPGTPWIMSIVGQRIDGSKYGWLESGSPYLFRDDDIKIAALALVAAGLQLVEGATT